MFEFACLKLGCEANREIIVSLTPRMLTIQEVAEYLQLTSETVYRYVRQGKLVATKLGRRYRIPRENVELFLWPPLSQVRHDIVLSQKHQIQEWLNEDQIDPETPLNWEESSCALVEVRRHAVSGYEPPVPPILRRESA